METRQQELYSDILSDTVVDWGGPGEEWVNSATQQREQDSPQNMSHPSGEEAVQDQNSVEAFQNGMKWRERVGEQAEKSSSCQNHWGFTASYTPKWVRPNSWDVRQDDSECENLMAGLHSDPLKESDEDTVSEVNLNNTMTEEEREEIQLELSKLEEEMGTLRQVLTSKEKQHAELKQKLGITPLSELRSNLSRNWMDMQSSTAYKRTSETLSTAGQKTSAAFSTLGSTISKKFEDMSYSIKHSVSMPAMRNSPSFKSFEEKVESTVTTLKTKVGGTKSGGSFEDVLSSAANASSQDTPTNNLAESSERQC
ncbi:tumor protein D53 isoform X5 [Synchiropus splendidus]|uniref:tumor protein D53 isoform X5 n=1 Tax=Synchiropus splendidus TaxID=270530 RepID=UPI00237E861F|nr:tumor protein D53 isoform X5 [Synchiropus splendidus]